MAVPPTASSGPSEAPEPEPSPGSELFRPAALREHRRGTDDSAGEPLRLTSSWSRWPARALSALRRRRAIPFVPQATETDCAAACLAMVLAYHGKSLRLEEVRRAVGQGRHGAHAGSLVAAGRRFGLRGRGVRAGGLGDLDLLDLPAVLHWRFHHFVVLERLKPGGAVIVDPAAGRRFVAWDEVDRSFTGVALTFEPAEEFEPGAAPPLGVGRHLRKVLAQPGLIARVLAASVAIQLLALAVPVAVGLLVDRVVPRGEERLLAVLAAGMVGLVGFHWLAGLARALVLLRLRTRLDSRMTLDFLDHLIDLPYPFFQQRSAGDLLMRLNSNATIREILTTGALSGLLDGVTVGVYLVLMLAIDVRLGLVVAALGAARIGLFFATRRRQRELMTRSLLAQAESQGYQVQMLAGIETLKASGAEQRAVDRFTRLFVAELNAALARGRLDAVVSSTLEALAVASPLVVLLYGATRVLGGEISLGTLLALNAVAAGFLLPLSTLVSSGFQLQLLRSYLERLNDVIETPREQADSPRRRLPRLDGRIVLEEVTFRYSPVAPPALREVSLTIEPGRTVAVVGATGSGKSTLAGLIAGLYRPEAGRVLIDGVELGQLDLRWLRGRIAFVAQQPYIFGVSIRENIALTAPGSPLAAIEEAARRAGLDDEIAALPMGYDTLVGEGGGSLSGGQRQRLALARALLGEPALLILDEATSALDAATEAAVLANLERLRATRIVISHRLSTVRDADLIVVLDRGRIVARGTHRELLAAGGRYRELVEAQLDGDAEAAGTDAEAPPAEAEAARR